MLLGKYIIVVTKHAAIQYDRRVISKSSKKRSINKDLSVMNLRRIIYFGKDVHIFTKGYKEFICVIRGNKLIIKTVIKRNRDDTNFTIQKLLDKQKQEQQLELAIV